MITYLFLFAVAANWLLTHHLKRLFLLLLQMEGQLLPNSDSILASRGFDPF